MLLVADSNMAIEPIEHLLLVTFSSNIFPQMPIHSWDISQRRRILYMALAGYGFAQDLCLPFWLWGARLGNGDGSKPLRGTGAHDPCPNLVKTRTSLAGDRAFYSPNWAPVGDLIDSILICGSLEVCFLGLWLVFSQPGAYNMMIINYTWL